MAEEYTRASAENITKGDSGDVHEEGLHPLKGTVKKGYKDVSSSKERLDGTNKDELEKQVHSAVENNTEVADKIQNSENK